MNKSKEKELLYSMLGDMIKERNELMKFILNKIDKIDNVVADESEQEEPISDLGNKEDNDNVEDVVVEPIITNLLNLKQDDNLEDDVIESESQVEASVEDDEENVEEEVEEFLVEAETPEEATVLGDEVDDSEDGDEVSVDESAEDEVDISENVAPALTLEEIIENRNRSLGLENVSANNKSKDLIPKSEIQRQKDIERKKRPSTLNVDKIKGKVVSILKSSEKPLTVAEIHSILNDNLSDNGESEVKIKNLRNNILPRIMKSNKNITRPIRGAYFYNKTT